ncbi:MAG: hypothetical protein NVS1B6_00110 [Steroidobacteraceae bacterium]
MIHAGLSKKSINPGRQFAKAIGVETPEHYERGGVIGVASIVDCVTRHPSKWFEGPYGFVLADVRPLPFVPCRGALGLNRAPLDLLQRLNLPDEP